MALMDFIKKQFIDIIQYTESGDGMLASRYPMPDFEIQYGGSLTVRESQMALFVNEGKAADAFGPGMYKLTTQTLPVLTYLKNWDKLFESPFKSDVYFFSTRLQLNRKWGTPQAITIRDKDFGAVRLRAFGKDQPKRLGSFAIRVGQQLRPPRRRAARSKATFQAKAIFIICHGAPGTIASPSRRGAVSNGSAPKATLKPPDGVLHCRIESGVLGHHHDLVR